MKTKTKEEAARIFAMAIPIVLLTCITAQFIQPTDLPSTVFMLFLMSIYTLLETMLVLGRIKRRDPYFLIFVSVAALWMYQILWLVEQALMPGGLSIIGFSEFFINTVMCTVLLIVFDAALFYVVVIEASRRFRKLLFF